MYTHRIGDISISSILDKRRPFVNGDFPVRIRVHYNKQKKYYSTGKTCNQEMWDKLPAAKGKILADMRTEIQDSFSIIKEHVLNLYAKDNFTLDNLDKSLQRISGKTLNYLLNNNAMCDGRNVCYKTTNCIYKKRYFFVGLKINFNFVMIALVGFLIY